MDLSVVIVTFNSARHIDACLASLRRAVDRLSAEVCVVDNASTDETVAIVRERHAWVRVISEAVNGGFAHGVNAGMAATTGRYVLWLNPDSVVPGDGGAGLDRWLAWFEATPDAGVAGAKVLDPDGTVQKSVRTFPSYGAVIGARHSLLTRLWPQNPFSQKYLRGDLNPDDVAPVDWISGACLMHRREVSEQLGGLDDGFFMYFEDVDFCYRAHLAGWRVYFTPFFSVIHHIAGSSDHAPVRMLVARHRSMWRWYTKHFRRFWLKDLVIRTGIWIRCGWLIARRTWNR